MIPAVKDSINVIVLVMRGQLVRLRFFHSKFILLITSEAVSNTFKRPAVSGEIKVKFWCRLFSAVLNDRVRVQPGVEGARQNVAAHVSSSVSPCAV